MTLEVETLWHLKMYGIKIVEQKYVVTLNLIVGDLKVIRLATIIKSSLTSLDDDGNSDIALGFQIAEKNVLLKKLKSKSFLKFISYVDSMLICLVNHLVL